MARLIYNVTTKVATAVHKKWLAWAREEHIPKMIATGCFSKAIVLKLIGHDDSEGVTYAVQYHADNEQQYERYLKDFSSALRAEATSYWGEKIISFRTVMEVVN